MLPECIRLWCYSLSIITQRHGVVTTMLVASAVCVWVVVGQGMKGGVKDVRVGGWGTFVVGAKGGGGGVGVCTVQRLVVIKHRVVPALP